MATTLADARKDVRLLYGLAYSASEDPLFTNSALNRFINRAHYWLAGITRCYFNEALSVSLTDNTYVYALDAKVIEPQIDSFRFNLSAGGSSYTRLGWRTYPSLLESYGPLEDMTPAAAVKYFAILPGDGSTAATQKIVLAPPPDFSSGSGTLKYAAWVYPAELSSDSDAIYLSDPNCQRLYSATCWQMAEFEASRGRPDAPVALWAQKAGLDATEFHRIIRQATREPARGPEVRESPLAGTLERMRPPTVGGGS